METFKGKNILRVIFYLVLVLMLSTCGGDTSVEESSGSSSTSSSNPLSVSTTIQPQVGSSTTIKGVFKDASGNPVASKTLTVTDVLYNETSSVTTDSNGNFEFTAKPIQLPMPSTYLISGSGISYLITIVPSTNVTPDEIVSATYDKIAQAKIQTTAKALRKKSKGIASINDSSSGIPQVSYYSIGNYSSQANSYSFNQMRDKDFLENLSNADIMGVHTNLELQYWRTYQSRTVSATDKEVILTLEDTDFRERYSRAVQEINKNDIVWNAASTTLFGACTVVSALPAPPVSAVCFSASMDSAWNTFSSFNNHMLQTGRYTQEEYNYWNNNQEKAQVGLAVLGIATGLAGTPELIDTLTNPSIGQAQKIAEIIVASKGFYDDTATIDNYISKSNAEASTPLGTTDSKYAVTFLQPPKNTTLIDDTDSTITAWDATPVYFPVIASVPSVTPEGYTISGTVTSNGVGLQGVTLMLTTSTGVFMAGTATDSNGQYKFMVSNTGGYVITPSKTGYTFSPTNIAVNVSADVSGQDFVATASGYKISGKVTTSDGSGLSGVTITLTGTGSSSTTTDSNGNYTFAGAQNGSYTITPSLTGYTFNPISKSVNVNNVDVTGQDFVGTLISSVTYNIFDYFPLKVGNSWTYNNSCYNAVISGTYIVNGTTTYVFEQSCEGITTKQYNAPYGDYLAEYGIWTSMPDPITGKPIIIELILTSPLVMGHKSMVVGWSYSGTYNSISYTVTLEAVEDVTVSAGIFYGCLKITSTNSGGVSGTAWYAKNVGIVKGEWSSPWRSGSYYLVDYTLY